MSRSDTRVAIIGAHGFIGAALARVFAARGVEVLSCVHQATRPDEMVVDVTREEDIQNLVERYHPTHIINASVYGVRRGQEDEARMRAVNIVGAQNIIRGVQGSDVCHVLMFGSWTQYAPTDTNVYAESDALQATSAYAQSLNERDEWLRQHRVDQPMVTVARIGHVYGVGEDACRLIPTLFHALRTQTAPVLGSPTFRRDFIYLDDVADACYALLASEDWSPVVNIGTGTTHSIEEVVHCMHQMFPALPEVVWANTAMRPWDRAMACLNVDMMRDQMFWHATTSLEEGLRALASAYGIEKHATF